MYITLEQSHELDKNVKGNEVAIRSFISDVLTNEYGSHAEFKSALQSISISEKLIYSRRFNAKLKSFIENSNYIYGLMSKCKESLDLKKYDNDVPYISELIDLLLIFFNAHFSDKEIVKSFSSIEEFHYCCTLYHSTRNNLSHPASRPITSIDANKVSYFIKNITDSLNDIYYWYQSKSSIYEGLTKYDNIVQGGTLKYSNLTMAVSSHKNLLCRETIISCLYESLLGNDIRQRLAGSIVLYGYGGVGKTAITTEFLYRVMRDISDGNYTDIEYLLFYSSKDEYLRNNKTTGELYIDTAKPEFSTLNELQLLICNSLQLKDISQLSSFEGRGIIAIDNIENIQSDEKEKIVTFIKSLPRSIQFIVTSRNEESCEEKIHIEEFKNDSTGIKFVQEIVDSEGFNVHINQEKATSILDASKGNALIILQVLNILDRDVSTFEDITASLLSMRSKNSEMIANFMYKNTFDNALRYLAQRKYPINDIMQIISLYDEKIELYSISKLTKVDVSDAEIICNYLLERLILKKVGEYYELNDFAKRFVFIKLLPDRFELSKIKDKIRSHKERMKKKLKELDGTLKGNSVLHRNVTEWQPKNYIDKIVIAELFSLYGVAIRCVGRNDKSAYENYLKEFNNHSFITSHPYVPLQKARLLKEGIKKFYRGNVDMLSQVEHSYEEAIESVEYDYRYLIGSNAHASLLMLFGIFLSQELSDHSRAIRFLEDAKNYYGSDINKSWFITRNYLTSAYKNMYIETNDSAYKAQLIKVAREVIENGKYARQCKFRLRNYKDRYIHWIE
ncbi:ATP-binding protein [Photobacterium sp. TY1-4]|uniref:ATP-binding protein n=1 Tax=Photobacterium sp. TY1-4 TaxID=2899122 RepID=UPI0021BFA8E7|nr:ATP-binding protein [Photobacterium sp. TY1-4]UXH99935.1 ATP-binding protein [Photobacterium sp. TY1-4]